jgi:medium-chain acyl-[acyl-carrier-protein] hydrolase
LPEIQGYLDRPFILYGHSMGALIAYEFARRMQRLSLAPECLMVSARVAPHRRPPREPINKLPQAEFVEALRQLNGTPEEVLGNEDLMALIVPMLRADFMLNEEYVYAAEPRLDCDILAFGGLADLETERQGMDDWREVTDGEFGLRMVPGGHFFIQTAQTLFLRMLSIEIYQRTKHLRPLQSFASAGG